MGVRTNDVLIGKILATTKVPTLEKQACVQKVDGLIPSRINLNGEKAVLAPSSLPALRFPYARPLNPNSFSGAAQWPYWWFMCNCVSFGVIRI